MGAANALSVLVVEDERIVARDLQETLSSMGYNAYAIASSADEAVARASERCPDIVLMDIRIKGNRDGIETAEILRRNFDVPVIYLTAHVDEATIERAKKTEPYGYLLKPVKSAELRSVLEMALYKHDMDKRIREREHWFSTTLRSIADAVITVDLSGCVTFMNPVAEELTGVSMADAVGSRARDILRLSGSAPALSPLDDALAQRRAVTLPEAALSREAAAPRTISDSAAPVIDDGRLLGAVMVFRDITEQKHLQRQLEVADRLASLGTMAAGVAHEVNNPLAVAMANAAFVHEGLHRLVTDPAAADPEALGEMLVAQSEILSAARRIERIVADLKALSRLESPVSGCADAGRAVEWAVRATTHEFRHRARLVVDVPELKPVAMDETRLGQILVNLLLNAAQSIQPGKAESNRVAVAAGDDGDGIVLTVSDTGGGMAPETLARVFEPFFTTKPVGVGTGLGLSICHGIVTSAGGAIDVSSQPGMGTTFRVRIPYAHGMEKSETPAPAPVGQRRGRILVVDDESLMLNAIGRVLRDHDVVCLQNAHAALDLLRSGAAFDIIFADIMMPEMTGIEFYEALLQTDPACARRVVFLTGGALNASVADFLASRTNVRMEKPFDVERLRALVQQLLAAWSTSPPA